MRKPHWSFASLLGLALLASSALLTSCADAPLATTGEAPFLLRIQPRVSVVGPEGAAAGALGAAFDQVNTFRLVVRRVSDGVVVADTLITVTPGQESYTLSANVPVAASGELFEVTITALQNDVVLFESTPVTVAATPSGGSGGGGSTPVDVTLTYSGPGATAASVSLTPTTLVLGIGGTASLGAQVLDGSGAPIGGVPLVWESSAPSVISVTTSGQVTGAGEGVASVTVTAPTGLSATSWLYVLSGELAFVRGGHILLAPVAGATASDLTPGATAAAGPSWDAAGIRLFYAGGGVISVVGGGSLGLDGLWPSLSPDGSRLAVESGGRIVFANEDGSNPTQGPEGTTPAWSGDPLHLYAGGGSIDRLRADGAERATVAGDAGDQLPAVSSSGRIAFLGSGGQLFAADATGGGRIPLLTEPGAPVASSRPTWSPDEGFLVFGADDGTLYVVAADGSAPAAPLPVGAGTDPAWKGSGPAATSPPSLTLSSLIPEHPMPGGEVEILGSGFDFIIPVNNRVFFPGPSGPVEGQLLAVSEDRIRAAVPGQVAEGTLRVTTRIGEGTLPFDPAAGSLVVQATTTEGDPLQGVGLEVTRGGSTVATGATDATGQAIFDGLLPEEHSLAISTPPGFVLQGTTPRPVTPVPGESVSEEAIFKPLVQSVGFEPDPILVEVGQTIQVRALPEDILGRPITLFDQLEWSSGSPEVSVSGSTLTGDVAGVFPAATPGGAAVRVSLDNVIHAFPATVTSHIEGTVLFEAGSEAPEPGSSPTPPEATGGGPATDVPVELWLSEELVATTRTDAAGLYRFGGLLAGPFLVVVPDVGEYTAAPHNQVVILGPEHPSGQADFTLTTGTVATVEISPDGATLHAFDDHQVFTVTARTEDGRVIGGRATTWTSTNPAVATVDPNGTVVALGNGTTEIIATVDGVSDTVTVVVQQVAEGVKIKVFGGEILAIVGESGTAEAEAFDANGYPIENPALSWSSDDGAIASINAVTGDALALALGVTTIRVAVDGANDAVPIRVLDTCTPEGTWYINSQADLADFAASQCGEVDGNLDITETSLPDLSGMDYLLRVTGDLTIEYNDDLTDISALARLEEVGGDFYLSSNPLLQNPVPDLEAAPVFLSSLAAEAPDGFNGVSPPPGSPMGLNHVDGYFYIQDNELITNLDWLGKLRTVGEGFYIGYMRGLLTVEGLVNLDAVGALALEYNPILSSPNGFPSLAYAAWGVWVIEGAINIGFPNLMNSYGDVFIAPYSDEESPSQQSSPFREYGSDILQQVSFPVLRCIDGDLEIYDNYALTSASFPSLEKLGGCYGEIEPVSVRERSSVRAGSSGNFATFLPEAWDDLTRRREERKVALEDRWEARSALRKVEAAPSGRPPSIGVSGDRRPSAGAGSPAQDRPLRQYGYGYGSLEVENNPLLSALHLPLLTAVGGEIYFGWGNDALTQFALNALEVVGESLFLEGTAFQTFAAPYLWEVGGYLVVDANPYLVHFSLPALESVWGYFYGDAPPQDWVAPPPPRGAGGIMYPMGYGEVFIDFNPVLTGWDLPLVQNLDYFSATQNDALIDLPGMPNLPPWVEILITDNPSLTGVTGLSSLTQAYTVTLRGNALTSLAGLSNLQLLGNEFRVEAEGSLQSGDLPSLQAAERFLLLNNPALTSFSASSLQQVGGQDGGAGMMQIQAHLTLTGFSFPALHTVVGDLDVSHNAFIPNLDGFDPTVFIGDLVHLTIINNPSLTSLAGLSGLGSNDMNDLIIHGNLNVQDNHSLTNAAAWAFLDYLNDKFPPLDSGAVGGSVTISENDPTDT